MAMLRAPIPLDAPLTLIREAGSARLVTEGGVLIGEATAADAQLLPTRPNLPILRRRRRRDSDFPAL